MPISDRDIKKLWGLSAGRCNYPGCGEECLQFIDKTDPTVIGEMAHIIARSPGGARYEAVCDNRNEYENLILLCPTHHTLIDKGPTESFPAETLRTWKTKHEALVRQAFLTPSFNEKRELCRHMASLLAENKRIWSDFGPDSETAKSNPVSSAAMIWTLRKLGTIVPNNRKLIALINRYARLFSVQEIAICAEFTSHAETFELSIYERQDSDAVPRFPTRFEEMILENAHDV